MKSYHLAFLFLVLCSLTVLTGCGGNSGPVTPTELRTTPTSEEPTGAEPVLSEEGP